MKTPNYFYFLYFLLLVACSDYKSESESILTIRKTFQAQEDAQYAFDVFKLENQVVLNDLELVMNRVSSLMNGKNHINNQVESRTLALGLSEEIDSSICLVYADKIAKLDIKVKNIEDAVSIYFNLLDSNLVRVDNPKLHKETKEVIITTKENYRSAHRNAKEAIQKAEEKFVEICDYREIIAIMSTVNAIREKIAQLNRIADDAKNIIKELDNFASNGKIYTRGI